MIKVEGSRRVTIRNRRFVRPMEPMVRNNTRPEPARRRPATQPTIRQELPRKTPPSISPVQADHVDETPAEVCEGGHDVRFKEVHETEDVHNRVDVWQDDKAVDDHDDAQARRREDHEQEGLFEDVTEVLVPDEGYTSPKRSPKPNPKYSSDDYNHVGSKPRTRSRRSNRRAGHSSR
jgi:hypothetical protein